MSGLPMHLLADVDGSNSEEAKSSCIFYKLMVPSILLHNKLRIPKDFVKRYRNELSSTALLTTASDGRSWPIGLTNADDKLWFSNGWQEFIDHYSIRAGFFLVFRYGGKSNFQTYMFDLTASEINNPLSFSNGSEELDHEKQSPTPSLSKKLSVDSGKATRDIGIQCNCSEILGTVDGFQMRLPDHVEQKTKRKRQDINGIYQQVQLGNEKVVSAKKTHEASTKKRLPLTKEEKARADHVAEIFKSDNPFCIIVLRPSYVNTRAPMHIPCNFAKKYFSTSTEHVILEDSSGKQWPVGCCCNDISNFKLSKGWVLFARDNKLNEGDVCVFELINTEKVILKVTTFRVADDNNGLATQQP